RRYLPPGPSDAGVTGGRGGGPRIVVPRTEVRERRTANPETTGTVSDVEGRKIKGARPPNPHPPRDVSHVSAAHPAQQRGRPHPARAVRIVVAPEPSRRA